jgi:hypothetical protein
MTPDEAVALLRGLGDTSEAVAASLAREGIRGGPYDECRCPLAVFIRRQPGWSHARVTEFRVFSLEMSCTLPAACAVFIWEFDLERYPELRE